MYTEDMLLQKIEQLQQDIEEKKASINRSEAKIYVYKEMIDEIKSRKKELNEDDMIRIARNVILSDREMQRIKKVVSALKNEGFEVDGSVLANKLMKTGKFRINPNTKYWELVDNKQSNSSEDVLK